MKLEPQDDTSTAAHKQPQTVDAISTSIMLDASEDQPSTREIPGATRLVTSLPADHLGTAIYVKGWRLDTTLKPSFIFVHDLGEHADLYRTTAIDFVRNGHSMHVFDLRGHGRSGRRLGHATFDALIKDLLQVAAWVRHLDRGRAPIVLGQGIGALIALEFAQAHPGYCHAIALSAPCVEPLAPISRVLRTSIRVLAEFFPTLKLPRALTPRLSAETSDSPSAESGPDLARAARISAGFAYDLLLALRRSKVGHSEFPKPILILCPDQDGICSYDGVKRTVDSLAYPALQLVDLEGVGHNVFTSSQEARSKALSALLVWVASMERAAAAHQSLEGARTTDSTKDNNPVVVDSSSKLEAIDL